MSKRITVTLSEEEYKMLESYKKSECIKGHATAIVQLTIKKITELNNKKNTTNEK